MTEQIAHANGIEIAYETFGRSEDPPVLLIMGLGTQMIHWHDDFCQEFVDRGYFVIRFDNRDAGHSTKIQGGPPPDLMAALAGDTSAASYTLDAMADDSVGLLDALGGIEAAHVVGVSMGGMMAQTIAIRHPSRILSLTSIMSTTGSDQVGQPREEALAALITPAPAERDAYVEHALGIFRTIGSRDTIATRSGSASWPGKRSTVRTIRSRPPGSFSRSSPLATAPRRSGTSNARRS